ncbi:MAG: hypothetical protein IE909_11540 [Campylobacterales bacterium]|nr:hypothetical protein [Campylobacterales bacterium]
MNLRYLYLSILFCIGVLNATVLQLHTVCINNNVGLVQLDFETQNFDLTSDAIVDNTGGYVEIPFQNYYMKTATKVYKIQGDVLKQTNSSKHLFKGLLSFSSKDLETLDQLKNITDNKVKMIQKIDLASNNTVEFQTITTTNIQEVSIDIETLKKEFSKCSK